MNKFAKIIFLTSIGIIAGSGLINLIKHNWTLGVTQLVLAEFAYLWDHEKKK